METTNFTGQLLDGKYLLAKKLGEGGMGAVYLGKHVTMGKMVAVKILHSEFISNQEIVQRFIREAQAAVTIEHKNIIDILDLGALESGEPFIVMEYLKGAGLDEVISTQKQMSLSSACAILEPTLLGISAAHEKGVIHRDLKPENIFLNLPSPEDVKIKVIDFGISKIQNTQVTKLTQEGTTLGTPAYMSPEQIRGAKDLSHLTDIYSVGVIFYEMLCGQTPFEGTQYNVLLANALTEEPRNPKSLYAQFPMEAWPIIQKAIAKDATNRYQSAQELSNAISTLCSKEQKEAQFRSMGTTITNILTARVTIPPVNTNGNTHAANDLLSDLVQQNAAMAPAAGTVSPLASKDGVATRTQTHGKTLLSKIHDKTIARIQSANAKTLKKKEQTALPIKSRPPKSLGKKIYQISTLIAAGVILVLFVGLCSNDDTVEIKILNAPKSAAVFYNNEKISSNPFRVEKNNESVPVRVEINGIPRMQASIVPSKNRRIQYRWNNKKTVIKKKASVPKKISSQTQRGPSQRVPEKKKTLASPKVPHKVIKTEKPIATTKSTKPGTKNNPKRKPKVTKKSTKNTQARDNDAKSKNPFKRLRSELRRTFKD